MRYQRHFSGQIVTPLDLSAFLYIHNTRDKFIFQRVSKYFHLIRLIGEQGPVDQVYRNWDIEKLFLFYYFFDSSIDDQWIKSTEIETLRNYFFFYYFFDSSINRPLTKWTISPTKQSKWRYFETPRKNKLVNHVLCEYID